MDKISKKQCVPIYVFDEHNEAFYFWQRARYEGCIDKPLDLFHVDAHDDMDRISKFESSIYWQGNSRRQGLKFYRDFTRKELDISNFIFPSVLCGLVKNVYFVYPEWRKHKTKRRRLSVCSAFGEGKVLKYGIKPTAKSDPRVFRAFPDLKRFNYTMMEIDNVPKNRAVILDIDLDYFACIDSTSNHMNYELEITKEQFLKRGFFQKDKTLPFSGLTFDFIENGKRYYAKIAPRKTKEISHLPSKEEIESDIAKLVDTLRIKRIKTKVVTISRSCNSGYCPKDIYKFIETKIKQALMDHFRESG